MRGELILLMQTPETFSPDQMENIRWGSDSTPEMRIRVKPDSMAHSPIDGGTLSLLTHSDRAHDPTSPNQRPGSRPLWVFGQGIETPDAIYDVSFSRGYTPAIADLIKRLSSSLQIKNCHGGHSLSEKPILRLLILVDILCPM